MGYFDDPKFHQDSAPSGFDDPKYWQKPAPIGAESFPAFLREELQNAGAGTRNIAGFGTALSDVWQGLKQFAGQGDKQAIEANRIISEESPVGSTVGNVALAAIPFGLAGNTMSAAGKVGLGLGLTKPVEGEQTAENIVRGKISSGGVGILSAMAGQAAANKFGEYFGRKLEEVALKRAQNADWNQTVTAAREAGLVIPPSSVNPSFANTTKESIAGKIATAQRASNENAPVFQDLARKSLGLDKKATLSPEALQGLRDQAYQVGYKPVSEMPSIRLDPSFVNELKVASPASLGGAVKNPAQGKIDDLIESMSGKGEWTGEQLVADIKLLREQASKNFLASRGPSPDSAAGDLARFQKKAASALERLAQRNMPDNPDALELLREARQYIAKTHTIEDAMIPGSNAFDPRKIPTKQLPKLTGELKTAAMFAKNFPKASQSQAQIAGPNVNQLSGLIKPFLSLGGGAAGTAVGGPALGAAAAAAPFVVPPMIRSALLSARTQNELLNSLYALGLPLRLAQSVANNAAIGGTVFGLQALPK